MILKNKIKNYYYYNNKQNKIKTQTNKIILNPNKFKSVSYNKV